MRPPPRARPSSPKRRRPVAKAAAAAAPRRPYGGKAPEQRRLDRRARLLASALDLFGTQGYARTNLTAICAHAGVSTRDFYIEFASRETLMGALYEHLVANVLGHVVRGLGEAPAGPRARVIHGLRAFVRAYLVDPRVARVLCLEMVGASPELEQLRRRGMRSFAALIETQAYELLQGDVPRDALRLSALALAGATNELIVEWLTNPSPPPVATLEDNLALIFLALLDASPRARALLHELDAKPRA
jgi:AcrR family transcriptional regulator